MMSLTEREARCRRLVDKYYGDVPSRDESLDQGVLPLLRSTDTRRDAGAGSTLLSLNRYAANASLAVGIDVEPPSVRPAAKASVTMGELGSLPFRDRAFDIIVSRSVIEHLEHPEAVFGEWARTLKPG